MSTPWERAAAAGNAAELRTFGESLTWQTNPPTGDSSTVTGIWSEANEVDVRNRTQTAATVWVNYSDVPAVKGDLITRGADQYIVADDPRKPEYRDGGGGTYLPLRKV